MRRRPSRYGSWLTAALLLSACATNHRDPAATASVRPERQCGPGLHRSPTLRSSEPWPEEAETTVSVLPARAVAIAEVIGAGQLVHSPALFPSSGTAHSEAEELQRVRLREQLTDRVLLALLTVKSAAAEADCEEERAADLADRLQEELDHKVQTLTLLSLVGGGLGGLLSGGLALGAQATASAVAGIAAGATESGFGFGALFAGSEQEFRHPRNLLAEVWHAPLRPRLLPEMVWRFLNRPLVGDRDRRSLRQTLVEQWRRDGRLGPPGSVEEQRRIALFFGSGGNYRSEELRDRAAMLDMLEADINLMSHDLEYFLQQLLILGD